MLRQNKQGKPRRKIGRGELSPYLYRLNAVRTLAPVPVSASNSSRDVRLASRGVARPAPTGRGSLER